MKIFKVVLIVLLSILGAAGIIVLGIYLSGGFSAKYTYPQDVFFANVSTIDGETTYTERGATPYNKYENFKLIISTKTEEFNQDEITLSFPSNQTGSIVRYLQKVDLDETFANDSVVIYYANDNEGNIMKFASCGQSQASYITNGVIIVPIKVRINREFDAFICLAPDNVVDEVEISEEGEILTKLYNIGGFSQLIARSSNLNVSINIAYINIDVPVEKIEIVGITGENISDSNILGLNEFLLKDSDINGYCEIGTDGLFSVVLDIFPARAVYKYGRNGEVGAAQYKTVVFAINSDEGLIAFAGNDGTPLVDTLFVGGVKYVQNTGISLKEIFGQDFVLTDYNFSLNNWAAEFSSIVNSVEFKEDILYINIKNNKVNDYFDIEITATLKTDPSETITKVVYGYDSSLKYGQGVKTTTLGAKFVAKNNSGQSQIHAGIFKNSILEDEAIASVGTSNYVGLYNLMNSDFYGIVKTSIFDVKEIAIDGFDVTDKYNQGTGTELDLTINNPTIIYANNPDSNHSLGIEISSNTSAQNKIRNILLSIQFSADNGDTWYDATQANSLLEIGALFNFYSGNALVTGNALGVGEENDLYYFNFFRPLSSSNMSYWQITASSTAEKMAEFGIDYIRTYIYYLNPNSGLVLKDEKYGPYEIDTIVNEPIETELDWNPNNNEIVTNDEIGAGNYNERILIDNNDRILLENIALIKNISLNPTYKTIRYFVYSSLDNLDEILNVQKYYGTISGVSSEEITIYEVDPSSRYLICSSLKTYKEIEFKLTFAIVEHLPNGSPVIYKDIENNSIYSIITLPTDENDYVTYAPIKIQKTLNITDVGFNPSEGIVKPYETGDARYNNTYFLQSTEKKIEYSFTVDDAELFEMLASKGDIILSAKYINGLAQCNDIYLYYENNAQPYSIALENVLTTIFATNDDGFYINKNKFENQVLTITPNGIGATYKITLSIKDISFGSNENEKEARIDFTYTLYGGNIPSGYVNPKVLSTNNFYIYSGKILKAYFGTHGSQITVGDDGFIHVAKTVNDGLFDISIYKKVNNVDQPTAFLNDNEGYLNVYLNNFGINDLYSISSSDSNIVQVIYNNLSKKFAINFLKSGTATITLTPEYAHSEYQPITLTFSIISNYSLEEKYWNEIDTNLTTPEITPPTFDNRIKNYNALGYQVVGQLNDDNIIYFQDLIQILAKVGTEVADVTDKFVFNVGYDQDKAGLIYSLENTSGKIELINDVYGQGIRIKNNFGNDVTLAVSAISANLGSNFVFNINIIPFEKIVGDVADHSGAQKPADAEPDSTAVYSSADIIVSDFGVNIYDYDLNNYISSTIPGLEYILYDSNGIATSSTSGIADTTYLHNNDGILVATLTFDGNVLKEIVFADIDKITKYTLKIKLAGSTNEYDIQKSFIFYISPNIKVDETSFENEEIVDPNGVIYLNNQNNPIINGEQIGVSFSGSIMILHFGTESEAKIAIEFKRILGTTAFVESVLLKIGDVEYDSGVTISGIKKLSEQTIILNYQGKEVAIKYWAAPNISLSEDAKIVVFDGQKYIALYATQDATNLYTWFNHNGVLNQNLLIRFGTLAVQSGSQKNILALPKLYSLHNTPNLVEGSTQYLVVKNSYGLVEATIIVASGSGDNAEFVTFKVLIFPIEWNYTEYDSYGYYNSPLSENPTGITGFDVLNTSNDDLICELSAGVLVFKQAGIFEIKITTTSGYKIYKVVVVSDQEPTPTYTATYFNQIKKINDVDIKTIFDGDYSQKIESGNDYQISTKFISSNPAIQNKFDSYINLNNITYNLYLITSSGEVKTANSSSDSVYIGILTSGKLHLITQPLGENRNYRLELTYRVTTTDGTATYTFSYYVNISQTQEIKINYPYGSSGTELEVDDFVNYQNVYYSQFINGNYVIDLNSSIRNFENKSFIELLIGDEKQVQNSSTASYNKLTYSIYKVFDFNSGSQITTNISNFITVTGDGIVTLKNFNNQKIGYIIKITTPNGAVGYYKIISEFNNLARVVTTDATVDIYQNGSVEQENISKGEIITPNDIIIVNGTDILNIGSENVSISKSFNLSKLGLAETTNSIKFGLIDSSGKVLNDSNIMMFIYDDGTDKYVVTKTSANEQRAILVVYTEKDGIIAEIEMVTENPYSIEYTHSNVWGDSTNVELTTGLTINNETHSGLNYIIVFNNYKDYVNYGLTSVNSVISGKPYISHQVVSGNASKLQFNSSAGKFSATETGEFVVRVVYNDDVEYYILTSTLSDGTYTVAYKKIAKRSNFDIYPLSSQKTLNITVYIWGTGLSLDGRTDETTCVKTIDLTVQPNIETKNKVDETEANQRTGEGFHISNQVVNLFIPQSNWEGELSDYKYKIEISAKNWGIGEYIQFVSNGNMVLTGTSGFPLSDLKLYISPVAAIRTATITVTLYKGASITNPDGEKFVATYTLTIIPDTTVEIKYPDYGTGQNFDAEYVYWKDYISLGDATSTQPAGEITLLTNYAGISVNGANITATAVGEYIAKIGTDYYIITATRPDTTFVYSYRKINLKPNIEIADEITFSDNISGHTVEYISSNSEVFNIDSTTKVITKISPVLSNIDIVITIKIDGINRAEYKIRLTNEPVFTARFDNNTTSKSDEIADTQVTSSDKLFELDFGKLEVQTKGSMLDKPFKLSVVATPKYAGRGIVSLDPVHIYGIGGTIAQVANIYLIKDSMKVGAGLPNLTNISSYDILGRTDDNDIWEIYQIDYTFKIVGTYYLTMNNRDKYEIVVSEATPTTATWKKFEDNEFVPVEDTPTGVYPISVGTLANFTGGKTEFAEIFEFTVSIKFKQESTEPYAVKFVTTDNAVQYYFVKVVKVEENFNATYYTSTKTSLTFKEIFGNNINYDMYDYSISYANSTPEQIQVIHGTEIDQPKALLTYYYNNIQIPYVSAKDKFKYQKVGTEITKDISEFTVGVFDYENETVVKVQNQFGTEVATYKYKIVYDYAFPESSFDEVTKISSGITSDKNIPYYYVESAPNINISGLSILSVEITENEGLSYSNGKFIATGVGTSKVKVSYSDGREKEYSVTTKHEFNSYSNNTEGNTYQVSKLIELNAGQSYDLINDILKTRLELTALNGNPFNSFGFTSIKPIINDNTYNLTHGSYLSNTEYVTNKTGILGIAAKTVTNPQKSGENYKDFTILPYGAQNGGDIIHLQLTFAGKTYILRIKIVPKVEIVSKESTGEFVTSYINNYNDPTKMKYLLSDIVILTEISSKDLKLSVLDDSDTQFVTGPEDNRLIKVGTGETTNDYGLVLYKTQLGGVKIRFKITDKYGYIATDSSGNPVTFTLNYKNENGLSPTIYSSSASIFEGNKFIIAYRYEEGGVIKYKQYTIDENGVGSWGGELENPPTGAAIIILDNISGLSTTPTINLTAKLEDLSEFLKKENGSLTSLTTKFLPNTKYRGATSISGETFFLTLSVQGVEGTGITETCRIPLNIDVNQRYKLRLKDPYDDFDKIYLRYGINYALDDLFELYDLLKSKVVNDGDVDLSYTGIGKQKDTEVGTKYLKYQTNNLKWETGTTVNYIDKVANGGTQDLAYKLQFKNSEGNITQTLSGNTFTINLNITPNYYKLNDSSVQKYGDYGVVVKGSETSTDASLLGDGGWGVGYVFEDYYENIIGNAASSPAVTTYQVISGDVSKVSKQATSLAFSATGIYVINIDNNIYKVTVTENEAIFVPSYFKYDSILTDESTGITFEKADGTNDLLISGLISNMTPDGSVLVNVKSDGAVIGTVKVTMSRYYKLLENSLPETVKTYPIEGNIVLPFAHPTSEKFGWGQGVFAVLAGTIGNENPSQNGAISGGLELGSLFRYSVKDYSFTEEETTGLAASLVYSETLGCYVINNVEDKKSIKITVKYMGIELGTINLARSGTDWSRTVTNP